MSKKNGDILFVGAGAIGGTTGAILYQKGYDVCLLNRESDHYKKVKSDGLILEGHKNPIKVPIMSSFENIDKTYNHIFVSTKNLHIIDVMNDIKEILTPKSLVYSMQNGFGNTDLMAQYISRDQIVAGVVGWGATKTQPGRIEITSKTGNFILGFENKKSKANSKLIEMKTMLDHWKPTIISDNIIGYRWGKLIVNAIIAPISAILDLSIGELLNDKRCQNLMRILKDECLTVANALNIKIEKVDGIDIHSYFYKPSKGDKFLTRLKRRIISILVKKIGSKNHGKIKSSMLWDLNHGRKTEIDFLNGYIIKKGKEHNLKTPFNAYIVKTIKLLEANKKEVGLSNFDELYEYALKSENQRDN